MSETTFTKLSAYISKMRMSHIYQPVIIRELLRRGGEASVEQIAAALLAHDRSQLEYYELRTKNMVGRVLANNGITAVRRSNRAITGYALIGADAVRPDKRRHLVEACDEAIDAFLAKRGDQVWSHISSSAGYIPGTLRYKILKRAKFRCELCGIPAEKKALEVDHIVPRAKGGSDDENNLQALCYSCNATKRDRDDADFRGVRELYDHRQDGCLFCKLPSDRVIAENRLAIVIRDGFPVTDGHSLIIPKRHIADYFELFQPELNAIQSLTREVRRQKYRGFNLGVNAGETDGQTIFHCHVHLLPRRIGDVDNPRGGVRSVISGKQSY